MIGLAKQAEERFAKIDKNLTVAIMGCVVNGPGEAKDCDIGIAGGKGSCVIFKKGEVYKTLPEKIAIEEFLKEIRDLVK